MMMKKIYIDTKRPSPFGDMTYDINQVLTKERENIEIIFEQATYLFESTYAYEQYTYVTNNDHGLKKMAFPILDGQNVTIDGQGATFVFSGRILPFFAKNIENLTIKNIIIDVDRPYYTQGIIQESSLEHVVITVDKERYPYMIDKGNLVFKGKHYSSDFVHEFIEFEAEEKKPIYGCEDFFVDDRVRAEELEDGRLKIYHTFHRKPMVGKVLVIKHEKRLIPAIVCDHCKQVMLENVTIRQAGTMGFVAQYCEDVYLNKVIVATDEDSERVVSTNTDATHFVGCKGTVRVENSLFESQLDDAINVHGNYLIMERQVSDNQVLAKIGHYQQQGIFGLDEQTTIQIVDVETMLPVAQTHLQAKKIINREYVLLTFEDVLDLDAGKSYCIEDVERYPEVIFRNNTVWKNRARGLLLTSRQKILVEDNTIISESAAIKISGDTNLWYEAGPTSIVKIRRNTIKSVNNNPIWGTGLFDIDPEMSRHIQDKFYHKHIVIADNAIDPGERPVVYGQSIAHLEFVNNKFDVEVQSEELKLNHCGQVMINKVPFIVG